MTTTSKKKRCDEGARKHTHVSSGWIRDEETGRTYVDDGSICSRDEQPEQTYIPSHWQGRHTGQCVKAIQSPAWAALHPDGCPTCERPTKLQRESETA